ncbi:MAG: metallophosphoesterase family protein [Anaerolineae bacterium]|nr:metallophosphoesterase family protein [Anaerolineae bacterium]
MKILTISDVVDDRVYSSAIRDRFGDVDLVLSCGDLPFEYLEYIVTMLGKPLYYVLGNHAQSLIRSQDGSVKTEPEGCINLHRRVVVYNGLRIAGLEGSMRYRPGPHQFTQLQMYMLAAKMAPQLWPHRMRTGRGIDILITHAAPRGIHDADDLCHQGFDAFLWLMDKFKPRYLIHGHIHLYRQGAPRVTRYGETLVVNTFGYQVIDIDVNDEIQGRARTSLPGRRR